MRVSFQIRLFTYLVAFFSLLFTIFCAYYSFDAGRQLYQEISARARIQAEDIAAIPSLQDSVARKDIPAIHLLMQKLVSHSDASFIVIGDDHGIHLYHSADASQVGKTLVGGDNAAVLRGKSITTLRKGGLGLSLRSKAPIFDRHGRVVGVVSVGYLKSYLDDVTSGKVISFLLVTASLLLALFVFSWYFTRGIKKQMFSLEPRQISLLVRQQNAVMESIYESVIAIDHQSRIEVINKAAKTLLGLEQPSHQLRGKPIAEVIKPVGFFDTEVMLAHDTHDEICAFNTLSVVASRVRIELEGELLGWVITFRDRKDIDSLNLQLSQVTRYVDNLRIMRHEQLNRMTTLAGLLHMARYDEAKRYIKAQSSQAQEVLDFISARFCSATLCGLLLGKYASAWEKGVSLAFDPACRMPRMPAHLTETELISIVGNLLDNAIEATQRSEGKHRPVEVYIVLNDRELVIEVADYGTGIAPALREHLFTQGVTTKTQGDHGLGLHLIANYISRVKGTIEVSDNPPHGTIFSVFIPDDTTPAPPFNPR